MEVDCEECGHPKRSHKYGGANKHGSYVFYSSCKKQDCACDQFIHPEWGKMRR